MRTSIHTHDLRKSFRLTARRSGLIGNIGGLLSPQYIVKEAVRGVTFEVTQGELVAFIGPNGAGKSTTIKMLTGILHRTTGDLSVLGLDPARDRRTLAYRIGSVFGQKAQLFYHLPALETFELLGRIYEVDRAAYRSRLSFLADAFELGEFLRTPVRKLSLGQRMRCEIAAALLHAPEVLFLDEPTIGLDVIAKQKIREVVKYLNRTHGTTIFLTSHDAGDIETLADRTIVINFGEVVFDGPTDEFRRTYVRGKTVELSVEGSVNSISLPGVKVVSRTESSIRLELDVAITSIADLLQHVAQRYVVRDLNVFEPPMEEVIASIYRAPRLPSDETVACTAEGRT
jgi:ABC-2 type transport system ATP-binding protein